MWQAFVPATGRDNHGRDGGGVAGKKRRRAVAAGDGETVSAVYASIVQPGTRGGTAVAKLINNTASGFSSTERAEPAANLWGIKCFRADLLLERNGFALPGRIA